MLVIQLFNVPHSSAAIGLTRKPATKQSFRTELNLFMTIPFLQGFARTGKK
jgi:hypothetical protein